MIVKIQDLFFSYPSGVEALRGITLEIDSGEQVAVIGQNGAGKTTLVKHLNGLFKPSSGSVQIDGLDTRQLSISKLSSWVGYVFQNPDEQLFCRTIGEEVSFGPRNLGFAEEKIRYHVDDALVMVGLLVQRDSNPYDLSPTLRKMVALASVISMDPPIIVFDEPTTGQDAVGVARIARVIQALRERGKTVITITHDMDFCAENFSRVIAMSQGKILLDGLANEVLGQSEVLASTYVEPPQMTRLGMKLGLPETVLNQDEFLRAYQHWLSTGSEEQR